MRLSWTAGTNRASKVPVTIFSADGDKTVYVNQQKIPDLDGLFHSLGKHRFEKSGAGFVLIANEETDGHVIADAVQFISVETLEKMAEKVAEKKPKSDGTKTDGDSALLAKLEAELKKRTDSGPKRDMVMSIEEESTIEETQIHIRGNVHNLGDKAPRGFLQVAMKATTKMPSGESGRRELAEWLASAENPLTARVAVNRVWHWLFGEGVVRTTDNFGTTGEKPSHPELLDHLALKFIQEGWSVKKLVRAIVLSRTYAQSATGDAVLIAADPENRQFGRANRRRLQAEAIRDSILTVSGQLTQDMGGPTFKMNLGADYGYKHTDTRRSVYSPVFRNTLPELFEVFDFADPSVSTGKRNVSTVVPQALFLMNHPFVVEQAKLAALRLKNEGESDDAEKLKSAYRRTLGREPDEQRGNVDRGLSARRRRGGLGEGVSGVICVDRVSLCELRPLFHTGIRLGSLSSCSVSLFCWC